MTQTATHAATPVDQPDLHLVESETDQTQSLWTDPHPDHAATLSVQLLNAAIVIIPTVGLIVGAVMLWGVALNWLALSLFAALYVGTGLGITIGYHRYFTHKSFDAPRPVQFALAAFGSMAAEGPLLLWCATHRSHHRHSDNPGDPHSPHTHGEETISGTLRGFWHAHLGWLLNSHVFSRPGTNDLGVPDSMAKYIKDLGEDPMLVWFTRTWWFWVALGLAIPTAVGGLVTMSWQGALLGFIWGGLVRTCVLHHVTWSINSACHLWGTRPYRSHDHSRNNALFGVLGLGEGWHNNHHAFPTSARHGLKWFQFDLSWIVIWAMSKLGLVTNVKLPSAERKAEKATA